MADKQKIIHYVSSTVPIEIATEVVKRLVLDLGVEFHRVETIEKVYSLFATDTFITDYITLDIDDLLRVEDNNVYDLIHTLSTLIKFYTHKKNVLIRPQIVVLIGENTPIKVIQDVMSIQDIDYFSTRYGSVYDYDVVKTSVTNYITKGPRVPKVLQDAVRAKKQSTKIDDDSILLTPRQRQVLQLVVDRGATNKMIAKTLRISESTVKLHMSVILKKYKVRNRTQLAVFVKKIL